MGFTRAELESYVDSTVPDLVGPDLRLLFVGINPGLWTAATRHPLRPSRQSVLPGLARRWDHRAADRPWDRHDRRRPSSPARNAGSASPTSSIAPRPRRRSSRREELRAGGEHLRAFVRMHAPLVVAVAGITAYRTAFGQPKATMGEQPHPFEGARLFVVPNPSGLNAHETTATIAAAYREPAVAAGVVRRCRGIPATATARHHGSDGG